MIMKQSNIIKTVLKNSIKNKKTAFIIESSFKFLLGI